jgi:hypothetical protein
MAVSKIKTDLFQFWSLFKSAIKKANKRTIENREFLCRVYLEEIFIMYIENYYKKIHKYIFFITLLLMYLAVLIVTNNLTMTFNFLTLAVFHFIVIPSYFIIKLIYTKEINTYTYIKLQFLYLLIPIIATIQYFLFDNYFFLCSSLIMSCYCPIFIYGCLKNAKVPKKQAKYLKFYNFVFSSIFTICFYIINIYTNIIANKLILFIMTPLLFLHIAYEKLILDLEEVE